MITETNLPKAIITRSRNAHYLLKTRKEMGLSQSEMADALGLSSYTYVSNLESGRQNFSKTLTMCMYYAYDVWLHKGKLNPPHLLLDGHDRLRGDDVS